MDKIEICNMALTRLGVANINRIDEASEPGRACNQMYETVRQLVLRKYPWPFATRRVELALLPAAPIDYEFAYRAPSDAVTLRHLIASDGTKITERDKRYKLLSDEYGRVIYSHLPLAAVEYTANITDTNLFPVDFCDALAWKLAAEIAMRLTGDLNLVNNAVAAYNAYFAEAAADGENEQKPDAEYVSPLVWGRYYD